MKLKRNVRFESLNCDESLLKCFQVHESTFSIDDLKQSITSHYKRSQDKNRDQSKWWDSFDQESIQYYENSNAPFVLIQLVYVILHILGQWASQCVASFNVLFCSQIQNQNQINIALLQCLLPSVPIFCCSHEKRSERYLWFFIENAWKHDYSFSSCTHTYLGEMCFSMET